MAKLLEKVLPKWCRNILHYFFQTVGWCALRTIQVDDTTKGNFFEMRSTKFIYNGPCGRQRDTHEPPKSFY